LETQKLGLTVQVLKRQKYSKTPRAGTKTSNNIYPKQILWDDEIRGFGCRIFPSGHQSFVYQYRTKHGIKRLADLGAFGAITLDQARDHAQRWAAQIIDGKDPLEERKQERQGELMSDLCATYIKRYASKHKLSWKEDERRNKLYIIPMLGNKQVQQITKKDITALKDEIGEIAGKPYAANRVREQLSKMFELARTWGYIDDHFVNPAKGIPDFEEHERADYIKPEYLPIVKKAIDNEKNQVARSLIWLYLLTGKRRNELLQAKWSDLDKANKTLLIRNTKNKKPEYLALSDEAWKIIEAAKQFRQVGNPFIFPGERAGSHFVNIRKPWDRIRKEAARLGAEGVDKVTVHGLRHTYAVFAVSLGGADLGTVRSLLNHRSLRATTVYAKYLTPAKQKAANRQANLMTRLAKPTGSGRVVKLQKPSKRSAHHG